MKLRARVKSRFVAPAGDLTKLKQFYCVEVLMNRKWKQGADDKGPFRFETKEEADVKAASLDGLEVDISTP